VIQFKNLALRRGAKLLFAGINQQLSPGERIGFVGDNGTGKSSLFALLRGELQPDEGDCILPAGWRIAHVPQHAPHSDKSAAEFVVDGDVELRELEAEVAHAEGRGDGEAAGLLHGKLADHDAYTARSRAETLMLGLGFAPHQLDQAVNSFSGGWRMRLALAQTLMRQSHLLLLDEPTNHLDLDAIVWLEDWLKRYSGTLMAISHDRDFLDAIATCILHLDAEQPRGQQIKRYGGNYTAFETERMIQIGVQQAAFSKQQHDIAKLEGFISRFKAKASKAKQAQSRVKALERMQRVVPAHAGRSVKFEFADPGNTPDPMVIMEASRCGYRGDTEVAILPKVDLVLRAGQRIGLLGANGQGKSTLIKTLVGELPLLGGNIRSAKDLAIGYFAQHELESMRADDTPLHYLGQIAKQLGNATREQELRDFLGRFLFAGDMAVAPIGPFSGGEKARLALAGVVFRKPNLLLLDEPTNHLDLETREALTLALAQFEGTLVVVSHDRHLLRSTAETLLLVADGKVTEYDGDLDDYRDYLLARATARRASGSVGSSKQESEASNPMRREQRKEEAQERQRLANLRKPIERELAKLEGALDKLNKLKAELEVRLNDPAIYEDAAKTNLASALARRTELLAEIEVVEAKWMERSEALEWVR
jgi:ATP-binding cassette subfamily F protein 3